MEKRQSNEKKEGRGNIELFGRQIRARTDFLTGTFFSYFPPYKFLHSSINLLRLLFHHFCSIVAFFQNNLAKTRQKNIQGGLM